MSRDRTFKLRFDLSPEDYDRVLAAFFTAVPQDVEKSRHMAVYLDTPDAVLRRENVLWCFSRKDKVREGHIKPGEWRLDRDCGARSYVKKHRLFDSLGGVFTIRRDRAFAFHRTSALVAEIGLERAKLQSGNQSAALTQVQFTLREGEVEEFLRLVEDILPRAVPLPDAATYVERGYRLSEAASSTAFDTEVETKVLCFRKDMCIADAFKFIVRTEAQRAIARPQSSEETDVQHDLEAVGRLQSAFRFFAERVTNPADRETRALGEWKMTLEKAYNLDVALSSYLRPAVQRGRWETALVLIARIEDIRSRAFAALAQSWPSARVKTMFCDILEKLEADSDLTAPGSETFLAFITDALAKATEDIQTCGQALAKATQHKDNGKPAAEDSRRLRQSAKYLHDITAFLEPLAIGKAARRREELLEALADLQTLLDKDHHLHHAQTIVADAAAHIARLKQTKSQNAQVYAAGALAGFLEAKKAEDPGKALKKALANLAEVKPFWTKI